MNSQANAPSRWYYLAGAAVIMAGFVAFGVFLVFQFSQRSSLVPEIQVVVPGTHEIFLEEAGSYTVFWEHDSVVDGKVYSSNELPGMSATLRSTADGSEVPLSTPSGSMSYVIGGRAGRSVLEFEIEEPGTYMFAADYPQGTEGPDVVLAIGQFSLVGTILVSLGIVFGGLIVGVLIIVATFLKRRTSRAAVHRPQPEQAARATRTELIMAENPALSWQEAWRQAGKQI